jgi:hypothetical protein
MNYVTTMDSYQVREERQEYLPVNYRHSEVAVDTAREIVGEELLRSVPSQQLVTPLWSVGTSEKRFRTVKPISVRIYFDGGLFFAENKVLLLYGTGVSPDEAIEDLGLHIIHFFQYYKNLDWSQITGDALRLKKLYEGLLLEE